MVKSAKFVRRMFNKNLAENLTSEMNKTSLPIDDKLSRMEEPTCLLKKCDYRGHSWRCYTEDFRDCGRYYKGVKGL